MKTKYVEPKGYWSKEMEKAFNSGKNATPKQAKKQTKKSKKGNK